MNKLIVYKDMPQPPFRFIDGIDEIEFRSFDNDMHQLCSDKPASQSEVVTTLQVVRTRRSGRKKDNVKRALIEEGLLAGKSQKQIQTFVKIELDTDESPSPKLISEIKEKLKAEGRL